LQVKVYITPKQGVLDPQGRAIEQSLKSLGFDNVGQVRMGKYIVLDVAAGSPAEAASPGPPRTTLGTRARAAAAATPSSA